MKVPVKKGVNNFDRGILADKFFLQQEGRRITSDIGITKRDRNNPAAAMLDSVYRSRSRRIPVWWERRIRVKNALETTCTTYSDVSAGLLLCRRYGDVRSKNSNSNISTRINTRRVYSCITMDVSVTSTHKNHGLQSSVNVKLFIASASKFRILIVAKIITKLWNYATGGPMQKCVYCFTQCRYSATVQRRMPELWPKGCTMMLLRIQNSSWFLSIR